MTEPARNEAPRPLDVRVGSSTNALQPISSAERSLAAGARQWAALGAIGTAALGADQLTKAIVSSALPLGDDVHVSQSTSVVIALTAVAVAWMLLFFARSGQRHPVLPIALGFVLGGSLANLVDRVRLGHVTDFLDLRWWPAFNLADTFIVIGVGILFVALLAADRPHRRPSLGTRGDAPLSRP